VKPSQIFGYLLRGKDEVAQQSNGRLGRLQWTCRSTENGGGAQHNGDGGRWICTGEDRGWIDSRATRHLAGARDECGKRAMKRSRRC
jgi:hypothetical protein